METDVLIIGSGIAGLTLAIKTATQRPDLKVAVITKTVQEECNTRYAQGGISAVWNLDTDDFGKHIADTIDAGDGLCDKEIVRIVVEEGPDRVREVIDWGARFDKEEDGNYDLGKEGGHSENRILHYKDQTGAEMHRAIMSQARAISNITLLEHYFALDFLTQHHLGRNVSRITPGVECYGAYVLNKKANSIEKILSKITVAATGGAGQIYKSTTNPVIATGDGVAMMYRAKGRLENMEFVQFHPTSLYNPAQEGTAFLVSEAVRGFGAILKRQDGTEFMYDYDHRGSLAPRDIVARAIDNEMKISGGEFVYLDCRHLNNEEFYEHFPTIYDKCKSAGYDAFKDMIPVVPSCHYHCGGISTDDHGRTSIKHLFAIGECTSTGLHGANRLASNSLLEGLVFAHRVAIDINQTVDSIRINKSIPDWNAKGVTIPKEMVLITQSWKELKEIMSSYVGIVRSNVRLKRALDRLWLLYNETESLYYTSLISAQMAELRNLITIAYLVTKSASQRRESRGLHFTTDYPEKQEFIDVSIL